MDATDAQQTAIDPHEDPAAKLLTVAQVAEHIGVSCDKVMEWIRDGQLARFIPPGTKLGARPGPKTVRVPVWGLIEFLRANTGRVLANKAPALPATMTVSPQIVGPDGKKRRKAARRP